MTSLRQNVDKHVISTATSELNFEDLEEGIDDETTTLPSIDFETPEICECVKTKPTPPPDPLMEFWRRMHEEVEMRRLDTMFPVIGIGPPVSTDRVTNVGLWLTDCARRQEGLVGPRNIYHCLCPNLEDALISQISQVTQITLLM